MQISQDIDPLWIDGALTVRIDGRRFGAFVEDKQLIVRGAVIDGVQLPVWRPGFLIRVDSTAEIELSLTQLLGSEAPAAAAPA